MNVYILIVHMFTILLSIFFLSAQYIIRYRNILPNARERIMIFSFCYYSFLPKFEFSRFCLKNGGSVKEILMIPTPIVLFSFWLCSFVRFLSRFADPISNFPPFLQSAVSQPRSFLNFPSRSNWFETRILEHSFDFSRTFQTGFSRQLSFLLF